jgi:hypothetical protein
MIITKGCSQCRSETEHCAECREQTKLEFIYTPPNHDGDIVIKFEYENSKGETVTVSERGTD